MKSSQTKTPDSVFLELFVCLFLVILGCYMEGSWSVGPINSHGSAEERFPMLSITAPVQSHRTDTAISGDIIHMGQSLLLVTMCKVEITKPVPQLSGWMFRADSCQGHLENRGLWSNWASAIFNMLLSYFLKCHCIQNDSRSVISSGIFFEQVPEINKPYIWSMFPDSVYIFFSITQFIIFYAVCSRLIPQKDVLS